MKPIVLIESPYACDHGCRNIGCSTIRLHVAYAQRAMLDSIQKGEVPLAGHLLYTQVLDDGDHKQRELGIDLHLRLMHEAKMVAVYQDLGISAGMRQAIQYAEAMGKYITYRNLEGSNG